MLTAMHPRRQMDQKSCCLANHYSQMTYPQLLARVPHLHPLHPSSIVEVSARSHLVLLPKVSQLLHNTELVVQRQFLQATKQVKDEVSTNEFVQPTYSM